jgi:hypothetical protein
MLRLGGADFLVFLFSGAPQASGEGSNDVSGADPEICWWRLCRWTNQTTSQPDFQKSKHCSIVFTIRFDTVGREQKTTIAPVFLLT